jgi:hypothetical protein
LFFRSAPAGAKESLLAGVLTPLAGLTRGKRERHPPVRVPTACAVGYRLSPHPGLTSTDRACPSQPQGGDCSLATGFGPVDRRPRRLLFFFCPSPSGAPERRSIAPQRGSGIRKQGWCDARRARVENPWLEYMRALRQEPVCDMPTGACGSQRLFHLQQLIVPDPGRAYVPCRQMPAHRTL